MAKDWLIRFSIGSGCLNLCSGVLSSGTIQDDRLVYKVEDSKLFTLSIEKTSLRFACGGYASPFLPYYLRRDVGDLAFAAVSSAAFSPASPLGERLVGVVRMVRE